MATPRKTFTTLPAGTNVPFMSASVHPLGPDSDLGARVAIDSALT